MEKISEGDHDEVSTLMESEIDSVEEIHRLIVEHSEWEELERVDREDDEEEERVREVHREKCTLFLFWRQFSNK